MPHVIVKVWPGRSHKEKKQLADAISLDVTEVLGIGSDAVSVAVQDVPSDRWRDDVYVPEIEGAGDTLFKKPGYKM